MISSLEVGWVSIFTTLDQILTAGVAITAFSLLLYSVTFNNLRDRVARSFALILTSVVLVFATQAIGSSGVNSTYLTLWLKFQWVGIIILPTTYLYFSDAVLATTGKPSRGRRLWAIRLAAFISIAFLVLLPTNLLVGPIVTDGVLAPRLSRTALTNLFTLFYAVIILVAWINFARAYRRSITQTNRRRMIYLLAGSTAPALGCYPYIIFNFSLFSNHPLTYWVIGTLSSMAVGILVTAMAYSVAFIGVTWPDRVVKSRLFLWLMRGPATASIALMLTTIVRRTGVIFGNSYSAAVPIIMVISILVMEFGITLLAPYWDRWLFYGKDREDVMLLKTMEDRLLTSSDLHQFLEVIVAAVCDNLQSANGFIASLVKDSIEVIVTVGKNLELEDELISREIIEQVTTNGDNEIFKWKDYYLVPLQDHDGEYEQNLLGLLGFFWEDGKDLDEEQQDVLRLLAQRAMMALRDRRLQQQVVNSLKTLTPQVTYIQGLRAASGFDRSKVTEDDKSLPPEDLVSWVKDALTHYWGGPKLTESPLMQLKVVKDALALHDGNDANALRAILKKAIDQVRPEGERRFTGEWILYNILEMKFMEGKKVREIASRLAMSEADLYRKQRVAIEAVSKAILEMEKRARQDTTLSV